MFVAASTVLLALTASNVGAEEHTSVEPASQSGGYERLADPALAAYPAQLDPHWRSKFDTHHRHLSDTEIAEALENDLTALGSMSLGRPNRGGLVGAVQIPPGERWEIVQPSRAWATQETVDYLIAAIDKVHEQFPTDTHVAYIGHLSKQHGGPIRPHRSHQSGRDVDVGYYYLNEKAAWYQRAAKSTLDLPRSWAFVRALVTETDVEYIFMNTSVQKLLKKYALSIGEDPAWINRIFQYRGRNPAPIIRHAWGHDTHLHVRFYNPVAQHLAARSHNLLMARKVITPGAYSTRYKAKIGDTLGAIAKKFGTSEAELQRLNRWRVRNIRPGAVYTVPSLRVPRTAQIAIPPRQLPPDEGSATRSGLAGPK